MILPVTIYGDPILRKISKDINKDYPKFDELIENMYQTMYQADGVGLAAPQVGLNIRLFVVDGTPAADDEEPELKDFKKIFINPQILNTQGDPWEMEEGCLSLPNIRENVSRDEEVTIKYLDENWEEKTETYHGFASRIIQHEYDHLEGKLFIDHVSQLRKRLLKGKLTTISKGKAKVAYRTKSPK